MYKSLYMTRFMPWLMWSVATLFFAYQFVMRVAPGLMMPELMQKFHIDAAQFGLFASLYYWGYAGMQIPVALLLDRYGPRKIISICALLCVLGTFLLTYTNQWGLALLGRFLIGVGSAGGFLGASKVISLWFPKELYTKMVGVTFTFGLLGALYGGKPVSVLMSLFGSETVLSMVGFVGFLIALATFLVVKSPSSAQVFETVSETETVKLKDLLKVVCDKKLIVLAFANLLMVGSLEGFADVWGVPYLVAARGIEKSEAALFTSTVFFGMLFGGPILAYLSEKLRSEANVTIVCGLLMGLLFMMLLIFNTEMSASVLYATTFLMGILCCYQVLVFSMGVRRVPLHLSGITVAFLNCINMLGGSFFHFVVGQLMDMYWTGTLENDIRVYEVGTYTGALTIIPLAAIVGSFMVFLLYHHRKLATFFFPNYKKFER